MDRMRLIGLEFFGRHGCLAGEREIGQRFRVTVELEMDLQTAGKSDDLQHTVDWRMLHEAVRAVMEGPSVNLTECLAERIADAMLAHSQVQMVRVQVEKTQPPLPGVLQSVGVDIIRRRGSGEAL